MEALIPAIISFIEAHIKAQDQRQCEAPILNHPDMGRL